MYDESMRRIRQSTLSSLTASLLTLMKEYSESDMIFPRSVLLKLVKWKCPQPRATSNKAKIMWIEISQRNCLRKKVMLLVEGLLALEIFWHQPL